MNDDNAPPNPTTNPPNPNVEAPALDFPVVGIGASAGCVAALVELFEHMPPDAGMAFVIVVHLSLQLDSILGKATSMPVEQVHGTVAILPDHLYVIPPGLQLTIADGHLHVHELERRQGRSVAIDIFFRALADAQRERAICIVLSGAGSDGSVGLQRVKENGGVTLAQLPADAEYDGMPSSAISTGAVDIVLPVRDMGERLVELWTNMQRIGLPTPASPLAAAGETDRHDAARAQRALDDVMTLLHRRTGHDFRHYKRATVLRRLERRLQVNGVPDLASYRDRLEAHPPEAQSLLKDLLISVTNFFRDPDAFGALDGELAKMLQRRVGNSGRLRAWVAGCATGEEAYSIAMLLAEKTAHLRLDLDLRVFASDIDEQAIGAARTGLFPDSIVTDVAPVRLRQFFQKEGAQVRVRKELRERVVFAVHNVLRDPPFSQLDLVSCRNLLIYLDREVQTQVLELFHFALRPGGLLFLGSSESAEPVGDLFLPVDEKHRIYRANGMRRGMRATSAPPPQDVGLLAATLLEPEARNGLADVHERAREAVGPASVLVDEEGKILHSTARASGFLRFVAGAPSQNLLDAVRIELRLELRAALSQGWRERKSVQARRVRVQNGTTTGPSTTCWVSMTVHLVDEPGLPLMLVLFDQTDATVGPEAPGESTHDPVQAMLEEELRRTREQLRGTLGESAQSTEDLRASNEEVRAINEELQSTTEKLETSKEELQSVNEELFTVNQELKAKVEETSRVNDDLENLIASTDIAIIFVDRDMRIKRFTPSASRLFNLIQSDGGRSLLDITHRLDYPLLEADSMQAFQSLSLIEREVQGADGGLYVVRVRPYRTHDNRIDGAALTFVDITETRRAEERLIAGEANLNLVAESTRDFAIVTTDIEGRVTGWNIGAKRIFGFEESEIVGQPIDLIYTPEDRAAGMAQKEMGRALLEGRGVDERWHLAKDGSSFYCSGIMTPLYEHGAHVGYAKIARDLTESKKAEAQLQALLVQEKETRAELQRAIMLKDEFLAVMSHELKQPLNLIHVNAELMSRLPEVRQAPPVARAADVIRRAVLSQSKIIDDLLDLSRLRTGKLGLAIGTMDWTAIVTKVLDAIEGDAKTQQLSLTRDYEVVPMLVLADPVRVEQIVWNLLSNALKFTPAGGTISVVLSAEGVLGRLDVIDSGQGIDPEFLGDVFDMFRQADRSTTRPQGGMGIGLALVRQLAEAQGGKVAVASAGKGRGAHFSVWLPLLEGAVNDPVGGVVPAPALAGLRVLAVDDSADVLESFAALLRLEGAQVTALGSGAEALEAVERASFDILLSDVAMPAMDGYELISTLRGDPRTARLPAVALTGFGRSQDARRAFAAGFDAHLPKPIVIDELLRTVLRLLDERRRGD